MTTHTKVEPAGQSQIFAPYSYSRHAPDEALLVVVGGLGDRAAIILGHDPPPSSAFLASRNLLTLLLVRKYDPNRPKG